MKYKGVDQYRESLVHINRLFIIECLYVIQTSKYYTELKCFIEC